MACKKSSTGSSSGDSDSGSTCCQRGTRPDVYTSVCNTSNLSQDPTVEQQEEDNCGILERQDADEFIFSAGEIVVFRGTNVLKFSLMLVTKNLNRDKANL